MDGQEVTLAPGRPAPLVAGAVAGVVVTAVAAWLALATTGWDRALFRWLNAPPQPLEAVLAVTNPLLRPLPLAALVGVLAVWLVLSTPPGRPRRLVALQGTAAAALAWALGNLLKVAVGTARPLSALADVSTHGYPQTPRGMAFPSTHTAVAVAVVVAVWSLVGTAQRAVLVVVAVVIALDRVYIGAHWPVDVMGGAALGVTVGCVVLAVSRRVQATRADDARLGR